MVPKHERTNFECWQCQHVNISEPKKRKRSIIAAARVDHQHLVHKEERNLQCTSRAPQARTSGKFQSTMIPFWTTPTMREENSGETWGLSVDRHRLASIPDKTMGVIISVPRCWYTARWNMKCSMNMRRCKTYASGPGQSKTAKGNPANTETETEEGERVIGIYIELHSRAVLYVWRSNLEWDRIMALMLPDQCSAKKMRKDNVRESHSDTKNLSWPWDERCATRESWLILELADFMNQKNTKRKDACYSRISYVKSTQKEDLCDIWSAAKVKRAQLAEARVVHHMKFF